MEQEGESTRVKGAPGVESIRHMFWSDLKAAAEGEGKHGRHKGDGMNEEMMRCSC